MSVVYTSLTRRGVRLRRAVRSVSVLALVTALCLLAGCGSSSTKSSTSTPATTPASAPATTTTPTTQTTTGSPSSASTLALEANPSGELKYNKSTLTAKGTEVKIAFTNTAPLAHNVTVESSSGQILGATPTFQGGTRTLSLTNLKPGTYTFFCSVPGHRQAGMQGKLVVSG